MACSSVKFTFYVCKFDLLVPFANISNLPRIQRIVPLKMQVKEIFGFGWMCVVADSAQLSSMCVVANSAQLRSILNT